MTEATRRWAGARTSRRPLGQGDCERWRDGGVGQPTNTLTSAGLVVGGLWVMGRARAVVPTQRWRPVGYGTLLAAAGLGSVAYHGRGGTRSERAHDWSIDVLALATVLGVVERAVRRRTERGSACSEPAGAVPAAGGRSADGRDRRSAAVALAAALAAPIAYALGRTSSPTCRPGSWWQWHGCWHVLVAVAGTAWAERTQVLPHVPPGPPGSGRDGREGAT
jgi:hypothetical protein